MRDKNEDEFFDEVKPAASETELKDLLKGFDPAKKQQRLSIGTKVKGHVSRLSDDFAFIDLGGKSEATIKRQELTTESGEIRFALGDPIEAFVTSLSDGEIMLSLTFASDSHTSMQDLTIAMQNKMPVTGKITGVNKGGFSLKILGKPAFCPVSQIDLKYVDNPMEYLNKSFSFVITRIDEGGRNIVVSRVPILELEIAEKIEKISSVAGTDQVFTGNISRIAPFGLFIDMGGFEGLVHISEVSWDRAEKLDERFTTGQPVEYCILKIEKKGSVKDTRISLSLKQALGDPWVNITDTITPGQNIKGTITRLANFGAFVELVPGIEGLIHISEMSWGKRINHPSDVVKEGEIVSVTVLAIDPDKRTVSCSLKDMAQDPWKDAAELFAAGTVVKGTVVRQSRFGYFVDIADGVTGLLSYHDIAVDKKKDVLVNQPLDVFIQSIDVDKRRVGLSYGATEEKQNDNEVKQYLGAQQEKKPALADSSSSAFGEALKNAMLKKSKV